jgi:hypothetical protein
MRYFILLCCAFFSAASAGEVPSFRNDILPIFSKAGCNSGGCHGALAGKGGFRLSLFAYNPEADWLSVVQESRGRRVDFVEPGASLLLTKPTMAIRHKGGKRLSVDSDDYRTVAAWIAAGAPGLSERDAKLTSVTISPEESTLKPGDSLVLKVVAKYSDGTERDVSRWAKFTSADETVATASQDGRVTVLGPGQGAITAWYSSLVVVARVTAPWANEVPQDVYVNSPKTNFIDDVVLAQLQRLKLKPSPTADDATFVRRAFVDTIGRLPTPEEARAFIADASPDKHGALADRLMQRPEFVDYWAYKISDMLLVSGAKLRPQAVKSYYEWIRQRVAENTPWDEFARRVVNATGSSIENGATNFFAVHQDPESMAENVSQAFLSLSINCAKCHNHPLEKWTNDQYYAFANLFARVRAKGWGGDPRNGDGLRTLYVLAGGDLTQPRTGKPQPPAPLDAAPIAAGDSRDRREVLADWLTSPENPMFARAMANRVWANFMGVGLVESVDDLRATNPASNEKLLSSLAAHFRESRYDLRSLMRVILNSQAYRRSSESLSENAEDRRHYSRFFPRRLMAEVMADAIADITAVPDSFTEIALNDGSSEKTEAYKPGTRSLQLADSAVKNYFLKTFGRNAREITCECERSAQPSLVQALHLSNGNTLNDKLAAKDGRVTKLLARNLTDSELVDEAYLLALSRPAGAKERESLVKLLASATGDEKRKVVEDLFWSLLTSREFLFQH